MKPSGKAALEERLAKHGGWETATRNDGEVARILYETKEVERVAVLNKAAFFDEFFEYLREIEVWPLLKELDPKDRQRATYPFLQFVLLTLMRCIGGVQSMLAMQDVLLTDEALMELLGFNAVQVNHGSTHRGESRRTKPVEVRGVMSYETVADNLVKLKAEALAKLFNGAIACLAKQGMFPKQVDAILDGTDDEATAKYKTDDGRPVPSVTREKRPDVRANRHATKSKVTVWGWKLWVVWEPVSKLPLAIWMDDINVCETEHAQAVIQQAQKNIAGHAVLRSVALDRGFLDGKVLSAIEKDVPIVYIPAKSNMEVTTDAREIARRCEAEASAGRTLEGCVYKERQQTVTHGSGKNATTEVRTTAVVGIQKLACDWWNPEGSDIKKKHSKSFEPRRLNAAVVLRWDGAPKDAEKEVVILTTHPSTDPLVAFDGYDDRSLIENGCNREAKEKWFLEHHPKRSEAGVRVHAYCVFLCMALVAGFRAHKAKTDEAERRGQETGIERYRRRLEMQNRDKVVVFVGGYFGILRTYEFALLGGIRVREQAAIGETAEAVLARYGVCLTKTDSS